MGLPEDLLRCALDPATHVETVDGRTGFPLLASGHPITTDNIRGLDDED
jgi:hypothetical protein